MARLYADENFPLPVVEGLRERGHDVLTTQEAGNADQAIPDVEVRAFATHVTREVTTLNRKHFLRLHQADSAHEGIIVYTFDPDFDRQAHQIDAALQDQPSLTGQLLRVNRLSA